MIIDIGTGDGRAILASAAAEPGALAIGIDADARAMADASRRAARPPHKGGIPNATFLLASAERLPAVLAGRADLVTVRFPWGSLLRGCLGDDPLVAGGIATLLAGNGALELILAPGAKDGVGVAPDRVVDAVARAFRPCGLAVIEAREMSPEELHATHSTWARRLGTARRGASDRVATRVRLAALAAPDARRSHLSSPTA